MCISCLRGKYFNLRERVSRAWKKHHPQNPKKCRKTQISNVHTVNEIGLPKTRKN